MGINKDITVLRNAVDISRFKPLKNMEMRQNYKIEDNESTNIIHWSLGNF